MAKILVVDDEPEVCELIKEFLKRMGYSVVTALNGEDALQKAEEEEPDLMLLDIKMPGIGGLEVLRRIREKGSDMAVIMMTAVTEDDVGRRALKMGANDYIAKPVDLKYLETSVFASLNYPPEE